MKVMSLFSGAGGLALGLEYAGFKIALAVESDSVAARTLSKNTDWPIFNQPIEDLSRARLHRELGDDVGQVTVVSGGPPCQPFSKINQWLGPKGRGLDDSRTTTIRDYFRIVEWLMPRAFILENVPAFEANDTGGALSLIRQLIARVEETAGVKYSLSAAVLNAVEYGVPQSRRRLFIVGILEDEPFVFPHRTHTHPDVEGHEQLTLESLSMFRTAWDAIGDLPEPFCGKELRVNSKWAELLPSIPEGENYLYHTERGAGHPIFGWRRRYWHFLLKLSKRLPSWTITAHPSGGVGPFHWCNRRLSRRELCRLQTFPDSFEPLGSIDEVQRQIGNAVPVALAAIIGGELMKQMFNEPPRRGYRDNLIPAKEEDIPEEEPVQEVPEKFLEMEYDNEPHPGVGKGPNPWSQVESNRQPSFE